MPFAVTWMDLEMIINHKVKSEKDKLTEVKERHWMGTKLDQSKWALCSIMG